MITLVYLSERYKIVAERMLVKNVVGLPHFTIERFVNVFCDINIYLIRMTHTLEV